MILIDKPFASQFLIETIKENNFPIISTHIAREMIDDGSLNWVSNEEAKDIFAKNPNTPLYTNSENSISWIETNLKFSKLPEQISFFKNKVKFRELIKDLFPKFFYKGVRYIDLISFCSFFVF